MNATIQTFLVFSRWITTHSQPIGASPGGAVLHPLFRQRLNGPYFINNDLSKSFDQVNVAVTGETYKDFGRLASVMLGRRPGVFLALN
jgi:hypothetical protein